MVAKAVCVRGMATAIITMWDKTRPLRCGPSYATANVPLPTGFEPVRAEPNGFRVHRLNHSATTALPSDGKVNVARLPVVL
jgi:hypothetical protein